MFDYGDWRWAVMAAISFFVILWASKGLDTRHVPTAQPEGITLFWAFMYAHARDIIAAIVVITALIVLLLMAVL